MDADSAGAAAPILAAFAPGKSSREPIEFAIAASRVTGAPLHVVHVHRHGPRVSWFGEDAVGDEAKEMKQLEADLEAGGVAFEVQVIEERTVAGGLEKAMEEHRPQLVVLGSSKRGSAGTALIGHTAESVIHESPCAVAVVPNGYQRPEKGVQLIGAAYSTHAPEGREALEIAATLARRGRVRLRVITVQEGHPERQAAGLMAEQHHDADPAAAAAARRRLGDEEALRATVAEVAGDLDADVDALAADPAEALIAASRHVDLLVMGSRSRGPRRAVVLGSVSRRVLESAACPVLVLPRGAAEMGRRLASSVQADGG